MKKTGALLKQARESKNLTIQEVAMATKINHRVLKAIEDGDLANLPAKTFLRGFVVSYATLLKLDTDAILKLMSEELQLPPKKISQLNTPLEVESTIPKKVAQTPAPTEQSKVVTATSPSQEKPIPLQRKSNETTKTLGVAALIVGLIGLIYLSSKIVEKYTKEAVIDNSQDILATSPIMIPQPEVEAPLSTEATTQVSTTPEPTPTAQTQSSSTTVAPIPTPVATLVVAATPTPAQTLPSPTPLSKTTPVPSPQPTTAVIAKNIELIIEARADIEVSYSTKNGASGNFKLSKDQIHTFKSKNGINISISTGGAANIILNGKDLGTPGEKNKPLNLIY